jgi:hypothetical protein
MDPTLLGLAGTGTTLLGLVLGAFLNGYVRRKANREDRLETERLATYADLIRVTGRLTVDLEDLTRKPGRELPEGTDGLESVMSRATVVASKRVLECLKEYATQWHSWNLEYSERVHIANQSGHEPKGQLYEPDSPLEHHVRKVRESEVRLEEAIRRECA